MTRETVAVIFLFLIAALGACTAVSLRSRRETGRAVALLIASLIPPVAGNFLLIITDDRVLADVGRYIYFLGMDLVILALVNFSLVYCRKSWPRRWMRYLFWAILAADAVQLLLNPVFGHAFGTEVVMVDGFAYYRLIPYLGQTIHRVVDYSFFFGALVMFLVMTIRVPRVYAERYSVIFIAMVVGGLWQSYYIFSGVPVDRSMVGFAVFGLLVFYFSIYYRPMRLLDRMLVNNAAEMTEALFFFDAGGRCVWANNAGTKLAGLEGDDYDRADRRLEELFGDSLRQLHDSSACVMAAQDGQERYYVLKNRVMTDGRGRDIGYFLTARDNTDEYTALQRETFNAAHDSLTGLYNRERLYKRVGEVLTANPGTQYFIVFVDVKDFKIVNDIFGTAFGDYALQCIAEWISGIAAQGCVYGRLGGDTFGICMPAGSFDAEALEAALTQFVVTNDEVVYHVLIHLGVYEISEPELEVSVMFDRAHMALTTIQDEYKNHIAYYDDDMRRRVLWSQHITAELRQALDEGQIRPYLQPLVDREGHVVGAEALVRWIHPAYGFLSPAAFIPTFEKNGMIAEVDRYMWRCACRTLARWQEQGRDLFLSVNISPKDFYFMDVAAEIMSIVREYKVDPSRLRLEITETVMMTDVENRMNILGRLKNAGFMVEMDDFGSGYSSLNLLKDMPVDVLKIDMMFLKRSRDDSKARTILSNIISLSEALGISSLTEGVETEDQYKMLSEMGCALFQGYYFARPMPVEEFEAMAS